MNPRAPKLVSTHPRKDLSLQEFNVMKERLKFQMPSEAAKEPVLGTKRSVSLFVKVKNMQSYDRKRKGSSALWNQNQLSLLVEKIEESPTMTLQDMLQWSINQGFPGISASTLHHYLDMKLITFKVGRVVPLARNSDATKASRTDYATWLSANFGRNHIYIDECGFTLWTAPRRGRAPVGQTPNIVVSSQQGKNQSLVMAMCAETGMLIWRIVDGL